MPRWAHACLCHLKCHNPIVKSSFLFINQIDFIKYYKSQIPPPCGFSDSGGDGGEYLSQLALAPFIGKVLQIYVPRPSIMRHALRSASIYNMIPSNSTQKRTACAVSVSVRLFCPPHGVHRFEAGSVSALTLGLKPYRKNGNFGSVVLETPNQKFFGPVYRVRYHIL